MKFFTTIALLFSGLLLISSCASLTKEECLTSDWQIIGQRDGEQGHDPQRQFRRHINACEKVNISPDHVLWSQGFEQGLIRYCTPVNGLVVGQRGATYNNVCPPQSERGFLRGYLLGKKEYSTKSRIGSLENQSIALKSEIDTLIEQMSSADPTQTQIIRSQIDQKRDERDIALSDKEREIFRLSRIEHLVEQFLQNPEIAYDPGRL